MTVMRVGLLRTPEWMNWNQTADSIAIETAHLELRLHPASQRGQALPRVMPCSHEILWQRGWSLGSRPLPTCSSALPTHSALDLSSLDWDPQGQWGSAAVSSPPAPSPPPLPSSARCRRRYVLCLLVVYMCYGVWSEVMGSCTSHLSAVNLPSLQTDAGVAASSTHQHLEGSSPNPHPPSHPPSHPHPHPPSPSFSTAPFTTPLRLHTELSLSRR